MQFAKFIKIFLISKNNPNQHNIQLKSTKIISNGDKITPNRMKNESVKIIM